MVEPVADIPPKTLEGARRQFVELYGSTAVMNTYLKIALLLVCLLALGLLALNYTTAARFANIKPLVVRVDGVGRAEAVEYDAATYQPHPPEMRYFLTRFVVTHFGRLRTTVQRDYPDSLLFLAPALADATMAQNDQSRVVEGFVTNSAADEIDIEVKNVTLTELTKQPFRASVHFEKVFYAPGTRQERARETHVAQIDFDLTGPVTNALVRVNPLGLQITYFRVDQAFQ